MENKFIKAAEVDGCKNCYFDGYKGCEHENHPSGQCAKDKTIFVISAEHDQVNNPSHYTSGSIECIDAIKASMTDEAFKGFLKGNVQKYLFRYEKKNNPLEDLKKAQWYLTRLIQENEKNNS